MENLTKQHGSVVAENRQEHDTDYPAIGLFIKELREELLFSQLEFCQLIGFSQSQLSLIESGRYNLKFAQILSICSALKIEPLAFITNFFDKHRMCPDIPSLKLEDYEEVAERTIELIKLKRENINESQRIRLEQVYA